MQTAKWNKSTRISETLIQLESKSYLKEHVIVAEFFFFLGFSIKFEDNVFQTTRVLMQIWNRSIRDVHTKSSG